MFVRKYIVAISFAINSYMLGSCWSSFTSKICCCCGSGSRGNSEVTKSIKNGLNSFSTYTINTGNGPEPVGIVVYVGSRSGINLDPSQTANSIQNAICNTRTGKTKLLSSLGFCSLSDFCRPANQEIPEDKIFSFNPLNFDSTGHLLQYENTGLRGLLSQADASAVYTKSRYLLVPTKTGMVLLKSENDDLIYIKAKDEVAKNSTESSDFVKIAANQGMNYDLLGKFFGELNQDIMACEHYMNHHLNQTFPISIRQTP